MPLIRGDRIGPYAIDSTLGEGGMGQVYRARDDRLHRYVALKVLPQANDADGLSQRRLLAEARAAAGLDHPFICKVYEVGEADGRPYIAMEAITGETLRSRLARGRLDIKTALQIATEIAEAVSAAHRGGVVHRDLKPANIMIAADGHVKVLDFGLASRLERPGLNAELTTLTSPPSVSDGLAGTLAYMAPEQVRAEPADVRSDIFAFGVVLFEMLAGRHPFQRAGAIETAAAILKDDPAPWPAETAPPVLLQHVVRKALAKDPRDRYQSVDDVLIDLRAVSSDLSSASSRSAPLPGTSRGAVLRRRVWLVAAPAAVLIAGAAWWGIAHQSRATAAIAPVFRQVTAVGNLIDAALSPDGRSLAFITDTQGDRRLLTRDLAGGPSIELAHAEGLRSPKWTRDGAQIHYLTSDAGYLISRLGGTPQRSYSAGSSAWSPDGSRVVWASPSAPVFGFLRPDGARVGQFVTVPHARWLSGVDWQVSSDRLLLYGLDEEGQAALWIGPPDGTGLRRLYSGAEPLGSARWSPTTDVIYAFRARNSASDLLAFDVPASGAAVPRVLAAGLPPSDAADLSADGRWLLTTRGEEHANLWTVDLGGPEPKAAPVTSGTGTFSAPTLSPDGQWIAVVYHLGSTYSIVKIPVVGGEPVPLTSGANRLSSPAWSPDGGSIAFADEPRWLAGALGDESRRDEIAASARDSHVDESSGGLDA